MNGDESSSVGKARMVDIKGCQLYSNQGQFVRSLCGNSSSSGCTAMHAADAGDYSLHPPSSPSTLQLVLAALGLVKVGALAARLDAVAGQAPSADHEGNIAGALACRARGRGAQAGAGQ